MRCRLVSIVGAALGMTLVPACDPLLRQPSPDLPFCSPVKREEAPLVSQASTPADPPARGTPASDVTPVVGSEILVDKVRYPAMASSVDVIPEPRTPEKRPVAAKPVPPLEPNAAAETHREPIAKPPEDPPLVQAVRCFLDNQPAEAIALLERYDKPSQDLLISLLPIAVRLSEKDWQRSDPREIGVLLDQLDRVATPLHRHAPLKIKRMCLCSAVEGFGKYIPLPEGYGFKLGDIVYLYVELQNLADERQGKSYSFHLLTNIEIRDFNGHPLWGYTFHDPGPNFSLSERHDFYHLCTFHIPINKPRLTSGLYTLYVRITDVATGREVDRTLDFRVGAAYGQNGW